MNDCLQFFDEYDHLFQKNRQWMNIDHETEKNMQPYSRAIDDGEAEQINDNTNCL